MEQLQSTKEGAVGKTGEPFESSSAIPAPSLLISQSQTPSVDEVVDDGDDEEGPDAWEQKHAWDQTAHLPRTDFPRRQFFSRVKTDNY